MGNTITYDQRIRVLESSRKRQFYQCQGVEDDILCTTSTRKKAKFSQTDVGMQRQHDSPKIRNQGKKIALFYLQDLAVKIQETCNKYQLEIQYKHIPDVQNIQADSLSRKSKLVYKSSIPKKMLRTTQNMWRGLKIHAFSASLIYQLQSYWGYQEDPFAKKLDAFLQLMESERPGYVSIMEINTWGTAEYQERQGERGRTSNAFMEESILVSDDTNSGI